MAPRWVLAIYFHLFGAWIFLVQYATFVGMALRSIARPDVAALPRPVFTRLWLSFLASGAVTLALYTPQLEELLDSLTFFSETAGADATIVQGLWSALAGSDSAPIRIAVAVLVVLGIVELWRRDRLAAGSVVALLAVPLALLVTVLQTRYLRDRYLSYWTPMFALAFAGGLMFLAEAPARIRRWRLPDRSGMAVAMGLLIVVGVEWARRDARMDQGHGYAEALAELNQPPAARTYAVGADSEMFQYYVRERLNRVSGVDELEGLMATLPALRVAYHDVEWNSPAHRDMNALLDRRCRASVHPPVILYTCGVTE